MKPLELATFAPLKFAALPPAALVFAALSFASLSLGAAGTLSAQRPDKPPVDLRRDKQPAATAPASPTMTPEMWLYEQERRRFDDPRETVRRIAQQKAEQRRARIASRKWYGFSNLRPTASPIPFFAPYSSVWDSGGYYGYHWSPSYATIVVHPNWSLLRAY